MVQEKNHLNATYVKKYSQIKVHTEGIQKIILKKDSSLVTFASEHLFKEQTQQHT